MPKYRKLSHIYYCTYHTVWTPKYRFRVLKDMVADALEHRVKAISEWKVVEEEKTRWEKGSLVLINK